MRTLTDATAVLNGERALIPAAAVPVASPPRSPVVSLTDWPGREIMADPETAAVLHAVWSGDPAVCVPSPPGSGKTRLGVGDETITP